MIPSEIKTMKSVTTFKDAYNIKQLEPAWRFKWPTGYTERNRCLSPKSETRTETRTRMTTRTTGTDVLQ